MTMTIKSTLIDGINETNKRRKESKISRKQQKKQEELSTWWETLVSIPELDLKTNKKKERKELKMSKEEKRHQKYYTDTDLQKKKKMEDLAVWWKTLVTLHED